MLRYAPLFQRIAHPMCEQRRLLFDAGHSACDWICQVDEAGHIRYPRWWICCQISVGGTLHERAVDDGQFGRQGGQGYDVEVSMRLGQRWIRNGYG